MYTAQSWTVGSDTIHAEIEGVAQVALIIYPHWPPSNLVGVHRVRLIANAMGEHDWKALVLTVDDKDYEELPSTGSEKLVSNEVEVIKVRARPVVSILGKRIVGDIGLRAWFSLRIKAQQILESRQIDFIWFSLPSWYPCLFGPGLHRRFGVPYAVDYQDPWVHDIPDHYPWHHRARWTRRLANILEPFALKHCAFITAINEEYMSGPLSRHPKLSAKPNVPIQLGFSEWDHHQKDKKTQTPWPPNKKVLLYAGAYWEQGAPLFQQLIQAWSELSKTEQLPPEAHLVFIGTTNHALTPLSALAEIEGVSNTVSEFPDRLPYLQVLELLERAYGTIVIGSTSKHYSASKVFQLLLNNRPILAFLHEESEALEILSLCHADQFYHPYQEASTKSGIQGLANQILAILDESVQWQPHLAPLSTHSASHACDKLLSAVQQAQTS